MERFLEDIIFEAMGRIEDLGDKGRLNVRPEEIIGGQSKRTNKAELVVRDWLVQVIAQEYNDSYVVVEGFNPIGETSAENVFVIDPIDGTAYYARQSSTSPPDITITAAHIRGKRYSDVVESAIGNLLTGEIFHAANGQGARSVHYDKDDYTKVLALAVGANEGNHDPVIATDFYFTENAAARLKLRNLTNPDWDRFECLNMGSVAGMLAGVATGDLTAFYNLVGPTPWELAPGYLLIREAGGCVLSADTGRELGERLFNLDEKRVPVVAAYNEATARKILEQIKA